MSFRDSTRHSVLRYDFVPNYYFKQTHSLRSRGECRMLLATFPNGNVFDGGCFMRAGWVHDLKIHS